MVWQSYVRKCPLYCKNNALKIMSEHYLSDLLSCEIIFCKFKDIAHNAEIDKVILKKGDGN